MLGWREGWPEKKKKKKEKKKKRGGRIEKAREMRYDLLRAHPWKQVIDDKF